MSKEQQEIEALRQKIDVFRNKAQDILDRLKNFSYDAFEFEKEWFNKQNRAENAYTLFERHIIQLKAEQQISTANSYRDTMHSL